MNRDILFQRIKQWANEEDLVRVLILVGSRAESQGADELSDFDVQVFATNYKDYIQDDHWLTRIGTVWVCVRDEYDDLGQVIPTRLVIYEEGIKVDFAFYSIEILPQMRWFGSYKILVDKDGSTDKMEHRTLNVPQNPPTQADFNQVVQEFWFEVYHCAKYLNREDLWLAKSRDWAAKKCLLRMIEWNEQCLHFVNRIYDDGRRMKSWVSAETWKRLQETFAGFDSNESWNSLMSTINLFRDLTLETASKTDLIYAEEIDHNISNFIFKLRK